MIRRLLGPLFLGIVLAAVAPAGAVPTIAQPLGVSPYGHWLNPAGDVEVSVAPCGSLLCGTVTWVGGQALADASDAGVQHLVGTQLLQGYHREGAGTWQGEVFVPDMGATFFSRIHQPDPGHLKISGCILHGLLCKSQIWTRRP
ncbi:uncharacterized protein (DUF2147 family) [Novosphingobium sp. PhB165]|uniref:DUF2147 domain-containing protein n=1 Tax=Novosphingobium sp. PhB165 TaxID=2485105 RepID=UPI001050740A|nr:DUF2147 domain-containing protein [Novosphingobium sp. PhB165]TCM19694.1 uncharacterized protein (DUF2147 family) [Novosphingobium sp. PhB165]